ncbi:hypothetical protein ACIPY2_05600 [Paenarthrobacter sp. NPDC089675]|uniref:hypothetical protein n=1 Tax=Paenarthrobacter sp. NPDC089675 TaxID=3364376 RepID=UPI0038043FAD
MARSFIILALVVVALSLAVAGRFRYPLRPSFAMDRFFVRLQLGGNGVALVAAAMLPFLTAFQGLWAFGFLAAALLVTALFLFPLKLPAVRPVRASTSGRRSVRAESLTRTRWPYQTAFAAGYVSLLIYIWSIFGLFF